MNFYEIEVKENEYKRYKQEKYIPPGEYILIGGRPGQEFKNIFSPIAATGPRGFRWLVPADDWVIRELTGEFTRYKLEKPLPTENIRYKDKSFYPWQRTELEKVVLTLDSGYAFRRGLIVALGGGKTRLALEIGKLGEIIYITPSHLRTTVLDECEKWGYDEPLIITPESAKRYKDYAFNVIILDECLSCKNPDRIRAKAVTALARNASVVIAMTATPTSAKRGPDCRWLRVTGPVMPAEEKSLKWMFGINPTHRTPDNCPEEKLPTKDDGKTILPLCVDGWDVQKLAKYLSPHLTTIKIDEIMKAVPEMRHEKIMLKRPGFFSKILKGLLTQRSSSKRVIQARTATSGFVYNDEDKPIRIQKSDPVKIQWVRDFIVNNPEEPIVLFSYWQHEQEMLGEALKEYAPAFVTDSRKEAKKFTDRETNLVIVSANLSEGMNFQRSRFGIFLSNSTSPMKRTQAVGRIFRPGQRRGVIIFDLLCKDTLDESALELLQEHIGESEKFVEEQLKLELERLLK